MRKKIKIKVDTLEEAKSKWEHLKNDYPYLFSLAVRTNPFDPNASVEVK